MGLRQGGVLFHALPKGEVGAPVRCRSPSFDLGLRIRIMKRAWGWLPAITVTAGLLACGGGASSGDAGGGSGDDGSGGGGSGASYDYSGIVTAPSMDVAMLQSPSMLEQALSFVVPSAAATVSGLQPVSQATVELVDLDTDQVYGTAVTDSSGTYELSGTAEPAGNLVLRVQGSNTMRAPAASAAVDVNPVTETVVRSMVDAVAAGEHAYADYVPAQLAASMTYLLDQDVDLSDTSTIEDAISKYEHAVADLDTVVDDATIAANSGFGGTYGVLGVATEMFALTGRTGKSDNGSVSVGTYGLSIAFGDDKLTPTGSSEFRELGLSAADGGVTVSRESSTNDESGSLSYTRSGNTFYAGGSFGLTSADGEVIVADTGGAEQTTLSSGEDTIVRDRNLLIGFRQPSAGAPTLSGHYHLIGLGSGFYWSAGSTGDNDYLEGLLLSNIGGLDISNGTATLDVDESETDVPLSITDKLVHQTNTSSFSAPIMAAADGSVVLSVGGDNISGQASADGDLIAFKELGDEGSLVQSQLYLAVRKGSGCSASTIAGSYRTIGYGPTFDTDKKLMNVSGSHGALEISSGTASYSGTARDLDLAISTSTDGGETHFSTSAANHGSSGSAEVSVASDCTVMATMGGEQMTGAVLPDGSMMVLVAANDSSAKGARDITVALRR
ncbi:carboxypeptidase regulatory-like domain-containing protein [Solimonas terrae]|uniref:Carboxypeptidase regulatory-like domain-containing protein n=1 Tax=Solimonas terrae TaxID=1396819 RepID=A0A6M2BVC6_9GAMM|nr:carboxypeptidase regulatory-like domain-containing protein [Solimonas terrae]NGY06205.1 carboxypeptidase regulatory-like domain-containing protein [Solimonas terrae]